MSERRVHNRIIFVGALFLLTFSIVYAYDDGFASARKTEGGHFTIYYAPKIDSIGLAQQLNISPADRILVGESSKDTFSSESGLADMTDILFRQVCDILDMQLYSFHGNIKVCQDYSHLNQIYKNLFKVDLAGVLSFYVYDLNTIYISVENFKSSVLGHEIAHAIISNYFVVQPPQKVAEVLAGYVEYQLRKTGIN